MKIQELYPYWGDTHNDLLELVELLTDDQLTYAPVASAPDTRQLLLNFLYEERYWVAYLVGGYVLERPIAADYPQARGLASAMRAARDVTARVLEPYTQEGLRAVRTLPADPAANRPETNVPVAWLVWRLLELEIFTWGQIAQRKEDFRAAWGSIQA